jgi:hypothetical protein
MSDNGTPEATELVYVPEPSWLPAIAALGLLGVLAGIFVWWPYGVIGAVLALVGVIGMLRRTRADVERLPRRQKLTTAVLPAVPPRKPAE